MNRPGKILLESVISAAATVELLVLVMPMFFGTGGAPSHSQLVVTFVLMVVALFLYKSFVGKRRPAPKKHKQKTKSA